jgi:hypothetical protein
MTVAKGLTARIPPVSYLLGGFFCLDWYTVNIVKYIGVVVSWTYRKKLVSHAEKLKMLNYFHGISVSQMDMTTSVKIV